MTGLWCFLLCFGSSEPTKVSAVDSFCTSYRRVVETKEDLDQVLKLSRALRDKIQGNDLEYLCRCKNAQITACEQYRKTP